MASGSRVSLHSWSMPSTERMTIPWIRFVMRSRTGCPSRRPVPNWPVPRMAPWWPSWWPLSRRTTVRPGCGPTRWPVPGYRPVWWTMPGFRTTGSLVPGRTVRRSMFWGSIFRSGPNWPVGRIPTRWLVGFWRTRARGRVRITPWLVVVYSNCPLVRRHFGERPTGRIWLRKLSRSTSVFRGSFPVLLVLFPPRRTSEMHSQIVTAWTQSRTAWAQSQSQKQLPSCP